MPSPTETELRVQDSPVPTQTVCGLVGSMTMAPMDCTGALSKTGLNVVPPSADFHTPPLAAPTYSVVLPSWLRAARAAMRPLIAAEPMLREPTPDMTPESSASAFRAAGAGGAADTVFCACGGPARAARPTGPVGKRTRASSTWTP